MFKYKLVLEDGSFVYEHGLDEDDAVAAFALAGGNPDLIVDVLPAFNPKKQRNQKQFDDE